MWSRYQDLSGKKFGRLIVRKLDRIDRTKDHRVYWLCECVCGNIKSIRKDGLISGMVRSCGCLMKEVSRTTQHKYCFSHGKSGTQIHHVYKGMRQRCNNPNNPAFKNYGGRGIKCLWGSFDEFYQDMGDPPTPFHSLDRIDNNGNYCKENCRWANRKQQANNRRTCRLITFNGKTQNMKQWAEEIKISHKRIWARINVDGWSIEKALTTPV